MGDQTLAKRQAAFLRSVLDESAPLPEGWGNSQTVGMSVYRGNYRSALVGALESTFERTARYVGEGPFKQVSAHHAIAHPPSGWTIEEAGAGFDATCAELFANNPEVAELAWLEWAMLKVSRAPDIQPFGATEFGEATAEFGDKDWMGLKLEFQPRAEAREVKANLSGLWSALEEGADGDRPASLLDQPKGCIVSREGELPTFQMVTPEAAHAFDAMQKGAAYGEAIMLLAGENPDAEKIQQAAVQAGGMLGEWLNEGLIVGVRA
ncbi:HvfC/BufC N-terminal domain-containing protein [Erythrobacter crassostreae]|uniref:DNA-binding domain-containing protein n=1 Tax=Erythrobacter crassostreae TaxID=2828328 RepID=A0A9X1F0M3_9SPHN|nr:DNA-binding domain-containing protein [Erythrobacter crassostrea]MBV7258162.1 putative DNA-binding domain-containing protein [Erythrobacter crassostrea]